MNLTVESIVSFTPDHGWEASFTTESEQWTYPVVGWAVYVRHIGTNEDELKPGWGIDPELTAEDGADPMSRKAFGQALDKRGYPAGPGGRAGRLRRGIGLLANDQEDDE